MLVKEVLRRRRRPPEEAALPIQPSQHFRNFSSTKSQSMLRRFEKLTGTPRYFMGKCPIWQSKISAYALRISSSPLPTGFHFFGNWFWAQTWAQKCNSNFMFTALSKSSSMQKTLSSAYCSMATSFSTRSVLHIELGLRELRLILPGLDIECPLISVIISLLL